MLVVENIIPRQRLLIVGGAVVMVILVLLFRFFQLQVYNYELYKVQSEANIIRAQSIPAPRGLIYDRDGQILVDNHPTYVLTVIPTEMRDREKEFDRIEQIAGISAEQLNLNYRKYYRGKFNSTRLAKDLGINQLSRLAEHKAELPGINYEQFPERFYPGKVRASHVLGYIREVDDRFLTTSAQSGEYRIGDIKGWQGLEKTYENILRGQDGVRYVQVDAFGRVVGDFSPEKNSKPIPGADIYLTIDSDIQKLIEDGTRDYVGAVIVAEPRSGEVLAIASYPDYPPDLFTGMTLDVEWLSYAQNDDKPMVNRIINGTYPPGSTFKPIVTFGLLAKNLVDTSKTIVCTGKYRLGRRTFDCWNTAGHGQVNMRKAVEQSCNVYFYNMMQLMDLDDWAVIARSFGFGQITGIDLPAELSGVVPDKNFMDEKYGKSGWTKGHILNMGIGQG
ncbi:MAG: penicillin-binding protein 2, partial [Candidatus Neomarinimicrobiota bacterium]